MSENVSLWRVDIYALNAGESMFYVIAPDYQVAIDVAERKYRSLNKKTFDRLSVSMVTSCPLFVSET